MLGVRGDVRVELPATCSAIGSSGIPELIKRGYSEGLAAGLIAAGGTLGNLIPPSLTLILYGLAPRQSIGRLFMAGFGPGLMLTLLFAIWVVFSIRLETRPRSSSRGAGARGAAILEEEHFTWRDRLESMPRFLHFSILIVIIMVAMFDGWATPSEVAGIGAARRDHAVVTLYQLLPECGPRGDPVGHGARGHDDHDDPRHVVAVHVRDELPGITQAGGAMAGGDAPRQWDFVFWITCSWSSGFLPAPVAIIRWSRHRPAVAQGSLDRPRLVRHDDDDSDGDGPHPSAGRAEPVRDRGHRAGTEARNILWGTMPLIGLMVLGIVLLCFFPRSHSGCRTTSTRAMRRREASRARRVPHCARRRR